MASETTKTIIGVCCSPRPQKTTYEAMCACLAAAEHVEGVNTKLIELAGSVEKAKQAIKVVADWANSRKLDYAIETIFKKWLELDRLKPKEIVKKPFYQDRPMVWSETKQKWYVISVSGQWLEFADKESRIEWRVVK